MIRINSIGNILYHGCRQGPRPCFTRVRHQAIKCWKQSRYIKTSTTSQTSFDADEQGHLVRQWRKQTLVVAGGLLVFFGTGFATMTYVKGKPEIPDLQPGQDVSDRYEHIASNFDHLVDSSEWWIGISKLRKKLLKHAKGNVLEVSVGTGRNSQYYLEDQCTSITMIDQSQEMIEVAKRTFKETHPRYKARRFIVQSALEPIAAPIQGFDTIVQTMGLCSTSDPVGLLNRMGSVLKKGSGRILLLEHGHGHYSWLNHWLDDSAAGHAHKFGCWWNRDIGQIVEASGLEVVNLKRHSLGTTWWIELKLKEV